MQISAITNSHYWSLELPIQSRILFNVLSTNHKSEVSRNRVRCIKLKMLYILTDHFQECIYSSNFRPIRYVCISPNTFNIIKINMLVHISILSLCIHSAIMVITQSLEDSNSSISKSQILVILIMSESSNKIPWFLFTFKQRFGMSC